MTVTATEVGALVAFIGAVGGLAMMLQKLRDDVAHVSGQLRALPCVRRSPVSEVPGGLNCSSPYVAEGIRE